MGENVVRGLVLALLLWPLAGSVAAQSVQELELQMRRQEARMQRNQEINLELRQTIRDLERKIADLQNNFDDLTFKYNELTDRSLKTENTDIANLRSGQQQLYNQLPVLNWGSQKRDCDGLATHQQVKNSQSADGSQTLRYLCFDGRLLHLGTEVHAPMAQ